MHAPPPLPPAIHEARTVLAPWRRPSVATRRGFPVVPWPEVGTGRPDDFDRDLDLEPVPAPIPEPVRP